MTAPPRDTLTREAVVAATRELIVEDGLDDVSLRRVATSLGVSAPALYAYVASKRDLLRGVAEFELRELISRFEAVVDADPVVRLRSFSRVYIDYALENRELFKTVFLFPPDLAIGAPTGQELPIATQAFELPMRAITEAIANGVFEPVDPIMAALTVWTATHGCADVLLFGFALDDAGREELVHAVLDTVLHGLAARPAAP